MPPHSSTETMSCHIREDGGPSPMLATLLMEARRGYRWPLTATSAASQQAVLDLEQEGAVWRNDPAAGIAHQFAVAVSVWGGNWIGAHNAIVGYDEEQQGTLRRALVMAVDGQMGEAMVNLAELPGLSVVMASKLLRFTLPDTCAAVDRHASYMTNSLPDMSDGAVAGSCTAFHRQWSCPIGKRA